MCPHCRGAKASQPSLPGVQPAAHCDSCNVDFTANFDQSVELTFTPNAAVRAVTRADYCIGGPQVTPHIVAQQSLHAGESRTLPHALKAGIHCGPCLATNQNDRLDYFGTTVNITSRLCGPCSGTDLVLSSAARNDPEIATHLASLAAQLAVAPECAMLKGFGDETFEVWRVTGSAVLQPASERTSNQLPNAG